MKVISTNLSMPQEIEYEGEFIRTGIFKSPVKGPFEVIEHNIVGDGQADLIHHGGIDKAIYSYPHEHYKTWQDELNRNDFTFGQFGENLTTEGLTEDNAYIGDIYQLGTCQLEVSQPRQPCKKLGIRMADKYFPKTFTKSCRSGIYFRVHKPGSFNTGDVLELIQRDEKSLSIYQIFKLMFIEKKDRDLLKKATNLERLTESWRLDFKKRLIV